LVRLPALFTVTRQPEQITFTDIRAATPARATQTAAAVVVPGRKAPTVRVLPAGPVVPVKTFRRGLANRREQLIKLVAVAVRVRLRAVRAVLVAVARAGVMPLVQVERQIVVVVVVRAMPL
jgi:hypothetical protein